MTDLAALSATELLAGYKAGTFTPVDATKAVLKRIKSQNRKVNAFIIRNDEGALEDARASAARWAKGKPKGMLDGVPTSIKEQVGVKGWPTRMSSPILPDKPAKADAPLVKRLKENGIVVLGKTATPEFCWKGVTDSALHGVTRNPWNLDKTPGGSSGGAAAACALGMGPLHIGTDGGGSVRIPAAFCGVFGLKPTSFRVASEPGGPTAFLSQAGPLTRTVEDAALMLSVIAQGDINDPFALPLGKVDYRDGLEDGVAGLRIGYWDGSRMIPIDKQIAASVAKVAKVFEKLGAHVEEVDPGFEDQLDTFLSFWQPVTGYYLEGASEDALARSDPMLVRSANKGAQMPITRPWRPVRPSRNAWRSFIRNTICCSRRRRLCRHSKQGRAFTGLLGTPTGALGRLSRSRLISQANPLQASPAALRGKACLSPSSWLPPGPKKDASCVPRGPMKP